MRAVYLTLIVFSIMLVGITAGIAYGMHPLPGRVLSMKSGPITTELFSSRFIIPIVNHKGSSVMLVQVRTEKELYLPGDFLLIKGQVWMNITKVTVELEKNHRSIVHSVDSSVSKNGTFYANFTIPKDPDAVYWSLVVTNTGVGELTQDLDFKSASFSPFKQLNLGIVPVQVKCDYGLELVIKAEDGSPACVKPQTATILEKRGWTKEWIYINLPGGVA